MLFLFVYSSNVAQGGMLFKAKKLLSFLSVCLNQIIVRRINTWFHIYVYMYVFVIYIYIFIFQKIILPEFLSATIFSTCASFVVLWVKITLYLFSPFIIFIVIILVHLTDNRFWLFFSRIIKDFSSPYWWHIFSMQWQI